MVPFAQRIGVRFKLMHDHTHTIRATRAALEEADIEVLPWPANHLDLDPIKQCEPVCNERQLIEVPKPGCKHIPQETVQHLIESVPSRLQECLQKRGGHTILPIEDKKKLYKY